MKLIDDVTSFVPLLPCSRLCVINHERRVGNGVVKDDQLGKESSKHLSVKSAYILTLKQIAHGFSQKLVSTINDPLQLFH